MPTKWSAYSVFRHLPKGISPTAVVSGRITVHDPVCMQNSKTTSSKAFGAITATSIQTENHDQSQCAGHDLLGIVLSCLLVVFRLMQNTEIAGLLFLSSSQTHPGFHRIMRITCGITRIMHSLHDRSPRPIPQESHRLLQPTQTKMPMSAVSYICY